MSSVMATFTFRSQQIRNLNKFLLVRFLVFYVLSSYSTVVNAALNIDGTHAFDPATGDDDPSPVDSISTYYQDQHDCPLTCKDLGNAHSWITYLSFQRLQRCTSPMLFQLATTQNPSGPEDARLIRACTITSSEPVNGESSTPRNEDIYRSVIKNPKLAENAVASSIDNQPACAITGTQGNETLQVLTTFDNGNPAASTSRQEYMIRNMQAYFREENNCNEMFLYAYYNNTVAGLYIGAGLGKPTVQTTLEAVISQNGRDGFELTYNRTNIELCGGSREPERTFGLSIDTTGDLDSVQEAILDWSQGKCSQRSDLKLRNRGKVPGIKVFDIASIGARNGTGNNTLTKIKWEPYHPRFKAGGRKAVSLQRRRDESCDHVQVMPGDGCASLAAKCDVQMSDLVKYNPGIQVCGSLKTYSFVCCSTGEPFHRSEDDGSVRIMDDGTCKTHLIQGGDTCAALAVRYGVTVANLQRWNNGKTWAWTECKNMLVGYNMCVSAGNPPLPPPQEGTACGPLVPGTKPPSSSSTSLADLNPCPLKACCSNWGFCGPFPAHCEIHAPSNGGPGTKLPDYESTCISNCGTDIKENSGAPKSFGRIGYYESWNMGRECLWQQAKHANTDGTYTIMHWGFVDIDPNTWKPVLKDPHKQWSGFKSLKNMKRVVSFGGWAYSTEPATYNIIRQAIIDNRETFATNLAKFTDDEGIDGIDIDWEYPGAPDILVDGKPIGQEGDGVAYLKFLTVLKNKMSSGKTVSIAAPASFWYLKAFPIDRIAKVIDYIVYMTYDLHGQWDYGNPNAFDQCDSGKCIRSHVNLTETRNSLSIITKAGVDNNKIFVGESSYGRSFRMARSGCWGPMCEFTGSRIESDAEPGRCTNTSGYLANAEIAELLKYGTGVRTFRDPSSDSDVLLYGNDYVSYMTQNTKLERRSAWKGLNFAGTIDWAVDLQVFGDEDLNNIEPIVGRDGDVCVVGEDLSVDSGDLCEFSCALGFCPVPLCHCRWRGDKPKLPKAHDVKGIIAWDEFDAGLGRLCRFACKYGFCPTEICGTPVYDDEDEDGDSIEVGYDYRGARERNAGKCLIYKSGKSQVGLQQCQNFCHKEIEEAKDEGLFANYGCGGLWPLDEELPWKKQFGGEVIVGNCTCNNWIVNELAEIIVDALPAIFQIGCAIFMSAIYLVLKLGLQAFPAGRAIDAGLDMAATGAQTINYLYDKDNDPLSAFDWWILKTCGDTSLVPDELKEVFDVLVQVVDGISYKEPKKLKKGSGKKGDDANPPDSERKPPTKPPPKGGVQKPKRKKCNIKGTQTKRMGAAKNTLRAQHCAGDVTSASDMVITELKYIAQPTALPITGKCKQQWSQACYHYSSAMEVNRAWSTLTCPHASVQYRLDGKATDVWEAQHTGASWLDSPNRPEPACDRDEFPPAYLQGETDDSYINSGKNAKGQLVRFLPRTQNQDAGREIWKGQCFKPAVLKLSNSEFEKSFNPGSGLPVDASLSTIKKTTVKGSAPATHRVEFSFAWEHSGNVGGDHGLSRNPCWPQSLAALDPGFTLLTFDPYYGKSSPPYDYASDYIQGQNGS